MHSIFTRMFYRTRQGVRALLAWVRPVADAEAQAVLSPPLYALFLRMRRSERQHSLRVYQALRRAGHTQPDLLVAALLHDVGKIRADFWLPEKVFVVLVKAASARRYHAWGQGEPRGWRRPFVVSVQHPAWGGQMAAAAGASALAVELIRRHADALPPDNSAPPTEIERLLAVLQHADDHN